MHLTPHYEYVNPKKNNAYASLVDSEQPLDQITTRDVYGHTRYWLNFFEHASRKVKGDIAISKRS